MNHTVHKSGRRAQSSRVLVQAAGGALGLAGVALYRHQFVVVPSQVHALAVHLLRDDPAVRATLCLPIASGQPVASVVTNGSLWFKVRRALDSGCVLAVPEPLVPQSLVTGLPVVCPLDGRHSPAPSGNWAQGAVLQWGVLPRWRSQRIHMVFPITGASNSAVAMLEAKKRWGRYVFQLLAADVRSRAPLGHDTRLVVRGDEAALGAAATAVLTDLRAPLAAAAAAAAEGGRVPRYDVEDAADDAARRADAAARDATRRRERPRPLEAGGGCMCTSGCTGRAASGCGGSMRGGGRCSQGEWRRGNAACGDTLERGAL